MRKNVFRSHKTLLHRWIGSQYPFWNFLLNPAYSFHMLLCTLSEKFFSIYGYEFFILLRAECRSHLMFYLYMIRIYYWHIIHVFDFIFDRIVLQFPFYHVVFIVSLYVVGITIFMFILWSCTLIFVVYGRTLCKTASGWCEILVRYVLIKIDTNICIK